MHLDTRGQMNHIIGVAIGLIVMAIMVPMAINQVLRENVSTWGVVGIVFTLLLPILAVIGMAMYFIPKMKSGGQASVNKIISISVGLLLAAILIPVAMTQLLAAENASWGILNTIFVVLIPILAIIGIALYFVPRMRGG